MTVEKRDGKIKEFDTAKIAKAVTAAAKSIKVEVSPEVMDKLIKYVVSKVSKLEEPIKIDDIQNAVEDSLMKYNLFDVERCFHDYRKERDRKRFKRFEIVKEMDDAIAASKVLNSNANMDESSFGGKKGTMDSAYLKEDALEYRMNPKHAKNHRGNRIYIHDLDSYALGMHNCLSIPFDDLLSHNIITRQALVRPAGSINTFFQLVAVGKQLQSLQEFGGVSATHIDWSAVPFFRKSLRKHYCTAMLKSTKEFEELNLSQLMFDDREEWVEVPYVKDGVEKLLKKKIYVNRLEEWINDRKAEFLKRENLVDGDFFIGSPKLNAAFLQAALYDTILETKQAVEGLLHNLNTLQSRSGNQLPFSSINYGTCTLEEGRIVIKAILDATIKGTGKGATSIFPCQIFQMQDGVNCREGDPNYDLFKTAIRCTAKRMYPNYANCDWSVDKAGFEKSRKVKEMTLELLTKDEKEQLIKMIEDNPALGDKLGLELIEED